MVAETEGVDYDVVDVAGEITFWRGEGEAEVADKGEWYCDGLHFTRKGYRRVGEMMSEALARKNT